MGRDLTSNYRPVVRSDYNDQQFRDAGMRQMRKAERNKKRQDPLKKVKKPKASKHVKAALKAMSDSDITQAASDIVGESTPKFPSPNFSPKKNKPKMDFEFETVICVLNASYNIYNIGRIN